MVEINLHSINQIETSFKREYLFPSDNVQFNGVFCYELVVEAKVCLTQITKTNIAWQHIIKIYHPILLMLCV